MGRETVFYWVWVFVATVITALSPNRECNQDLSLFKESVCVDGFPELYLVSLSNQFGRWVIRKSELKGRASSSRVQAPCFQLDLSTAGTKEIHVLAFTA